MGIFCYFWSTKILLWVDETRKIFDTVCVREKPAGYFFSVAGLGK